MLLVNKKPSVFTEDFFLEIAFKYVYLMGDERF